LDENKKNEELTPEVEENLNEDILTENVEDENESVEDRAAKILSGLKESSLPDAVQDWDGVLPENKDEIEIIEDEVHIIDEIKEVEEEEDIPEEERCVICGKRRRCTSISEDYEYCAQCRIELLKRPYNGMGIVALVLVFFAFIGITILSAPIPTAGLLTGLIAGTGALEGYVSEMNGENEKALAAYDEVLTVSKEIGVSEGLVRRIALLTEKNQGSEKAYAVIKNSIGTEAAKEDKVLAGILERAEAFKTTYTDCTEVIYPYYDETTGSVNIEKAYAAIDELVKKNEGKYDEDTVTYFKAFVATFNYDTEKIIKYREEIRERSPEKFWLYNDGNGLLDAYISKGDYDSAVKVADSILKFSKTNAGANKIKAKCAVIKGDKAEAKEIIEVLKATSETAVTATSIEALLARLDGDYQKAIDISTTAIDDDKCDAETYYQNAVAMILKGDFETAYNMLGEYNTVFQSGLGTQDDYTKFVYIYILTAYNVDKTTYQALEADFKREGATLAFPEEFEQYKEGKLTLEDIFLKGDYELR